jgi:hypothetical protein
MQTLGLAHNVGPCGHFIEWTHNGTQMVRRGCTAAEVREVWANVIANGGTVTAFG